MKIMNILMIIIITILLVMSSIALISIHGKLVDLPFEFTPFGIDNYLSSFGFYKYLFTGTIATCSAYFGLLRVKATLDSNIEKIKQDRFSEWKTIVQLRCNEIEYIDPKMTREIIKVRRAMYNYLYDKDFKINSIEELTPLFNDNIANLVAFFEDTNKRQQKLGTVYQNDRHTYSFNSFRFIFFGMIEGYYDNIINDLENLYIANLREGRMINEGWYQTNLRDNPE